MAKKLIFVGLVFGLMVLGSRTSSAALPNCQCSYCSDPRNSAFPCYNFIRRFDTTCGTYNIQMCR